MKTPYTQQPMLSNPAPASASGGTFLQNREDRNNLGVWLLASLGVHLAFCGLFLLIMVIFQFLGWDIPLFSAHLKPREDTEYVLVDNTPTEKPRHPTRRKAEHASRSGGQKVANRPTQVPQQAAGPKTSHAAPRSAARPQARPRPAQRQQVASRPQPRPQPQQRQAQPSRQQPQRQVTPPTPHQQTASTPVPTPAPPAPKLPRPKQVAHATPGLPPNPIAPTIRMPAPPNPSASTGGGRIFRTPGSSSGGSSGASGSSGGNPGPSMIAGNPSRGGGGGGYPGRSAGGGGGGRGAYTQSGSPGGGGGRAGIDAMEEPDFGPYIAELQRRIRRNWVPPVEDRSKRVVAFFKIARDGRLLSLRVQQSSGSPPADQAAMAAVRASAPFRQLPVNFRGNDIDVQFIFDYEIYGHGSAQMR